MYGNKCAWCKNSMPTESGGWKCKYSTCQLTEYEITQIILRLAGTRNYLYEKNDCFYYDCRDDAGFVCMYCHYKCYK